MKIWWGPIGGIALMPFIWGLYDYSIATAGDALPENNPRAELINKLVGEYSSRKEIWIRPSIRVVKGTPAAVAQRVGVIHISPVLLFDGPFSEQEVTAILAHEMGHIARRDGWRLWNHFSDSWLIEKELAADVIGSELAGREAMSALLINHRAEVVAGSKDVKDPHPLYEDRVTAVGGC